MRAALQDCKVKDESIAKWTEETRIEMADLRKELDDLKERNAQLGNRNEKLNSQNLIYVATITKKDTEIKHLKSSLKEEEAESNRFLDRLHAPERELRLTKTSMSADVRKLEKSHAKAKQITKLTSVSGIERTYKERHAEEDQREIQRLTRMVVEMQGKSHHNNTLTTP